MKTILTQDEYQNQFVDFYKQTLGTGIGTTVGPVDDDDEQDDGSSRPAIRDVGGGDVFNPMAGTSITGGLPYNATNIMAGQYVRDNAKSARKSMDKSDSGFANYMKNLKNLGMEQLKERPGEVAVLGVASFATGLPLTAIGAVAGDLNRKKQYDNAMKIAASGGGNMMDLNGQTVSRVAGSKQYTGTLGNFTSEQIYAIEELGKGYIPGTMVETFVPFPTAMTGGDSGDGNGTYTTTGKSGLLDAATAQRLGGNYDAYGNWHSTKYNSVSKSGPLAGAKALANQYGVNTTGWTTQDYVNFSNSWKDSAKPSSTKTGIAGFFDNLFSNPLRDSTIDQYKTSLDNVKTNISNYSPGQQDDESDGPQSGGTIFDTSGEDETGGTPTAGSGFEPDDDSGDNTGGGTSFSGGMGIGDAGQGGPGGYGESYGNIFARGGRVGMQAGGVAAQPAGFVQGPPGQFSDRETVADDQPMEVPEGTFVINAPAVEHAGSQDIRKMILDAYTVAQEKGLDIGRVDRKLYEGTVDVALSKGEVVVPPELAKIIGYDRLEKINNRGKKEVSRRQEASEGGFLGLAEGGSAYEYEDPIILDEVNKGMSGGFISMAEGGVPTPTRRPKREQLADIELRADLETFIQGDALARLGYKLYEDGHVRFNTVIDPDEYTGKKTKFKGAYFPPGDVRTDRRGVIPIRDIGREGKIMELQGIAPSQLKSDAGRVVLAGNMFDTSETTIDMITIAHEFRHAALDYLSKTYDLGLPTLRQEERIMDYADNQAIERAGKVNPKLKERYFSNPDYKLMSERGKSAGDSAYLRKQYEQYTGLAEEILEAMDVPPQSPAIEKEGFLTRTYKSLVN